MMEPSALLVVDMQVDFCAGGSLAVPGADLMIPLINRYMEICANTGIPIFVSRDWHPAETTHFSQFGGVWPPHCIQNTPGAAFHTGLKPPAKHVVFSKGMDPRQDQYSTFEAAAADGLTLKHYLSSLGITTIYICGVATDYCVRETALDAIADGYSVLVLGDAVKGVNLTQGASEKALADITAAGGKVIGFNDFLRSVER